MQPDLWSENFALQNEACNAAVYTSLLIYAEGLLGTEIVFLQRVDILLLSDQSTICNSNPNLGTQYKGKAGSGCRGRSWL